MTTDLDRALIALRVSRDHGHGAVLNDAEVPALLAEFDRLTRERDEIAARLESAVDALTHKRPLMTTAKTVDDWRRIAEHLDFEWSECSRHLNKVAAQRDEARAERDALAKDAERYRWLRDKANFARDHDPMVCLNPLDEQELICGPELDAAMDAVLAQIEKERSDG